MKVMMKVMMKMMMKVMMKVLKTYASSKHCEFICLHLSKQLFANIRDTGTKDALNRDIWQVFQIFKIY